MSTNIDLPIELLDEVIEHALPSDQATCCRVSRILNDVSTRRLYRSISLLSPSQVVQCCKTLSSNGLAASSVRSLQINVPRDGSGHAHSRADTQIFFPIFYRVLNAALDRIKNVTELAFNCYDPSKMAPLTAHRFPHLRSLGASQLQCTTDVALFLAAHPLLQVISISPPFHFDLFDVPPCPSVRLEHLVSFSGSHRFISHVIQSTSLRALRTSIFPHEDCEKILGSVKAHAYHLEVLHIAFFFYHDTIGQAIASHLPGLRLLDLSIWGWLSKNQADQMVESMLAVLPQFKRLTAIMFPAYGSDGDVVETCIHTDAKTIAALADACPTLDFCRLPSRPWIRKYCGRWHPISGIP